MARTLVSFLIALAVANGVHAGQIIPPDRTFVPTWQQAGYPGPISTPARIVNVRDFGALGTGKTNDFPAVTRAIASLHNQPGVIYFPTGVYLLESMVKIPGGTVFRGASPQQTTLLFDQLGEGLYIAQPQTALFQPVLSGYSIHSTSIVVSNAGEFAAGNYAEIHEDNDPGIDASPWGRKVVGQMLHVAAVTGNTLTLEQPLRTTYRAEQHPEIRKITPITEVGIENLRLERLVKGTDTQRNNLYTILFDYAARCWVRGVEGCNTFGGHLGAYHSTQISITGCYFHHAHFYGGGGSGYGVRLEYQTGECLVEDNIFQHLRHSMLVQLGVNGNVFGYNYSCEPVRTEFPSEVSGDIVVHGNYPYANLFERNICQHIWIDDSHGVNGPLNTFFRNRAESYGFTITDPRADNQNIVGNETFKGTYSAFLGGSYGLEGTGHFAYANNTISKGIEPPGTTNLTDVSYYLTNTPAFWNIPDKLPTVGPPLDLNVSKNIPARVRFLSHTNLTVYSTPP
jgi:hypothetical protein